MSKIKYYAMKVTRKLNNQRRQFSQRDCGKLGSQCRFILETVAAFATQVKIYLKKHSFIINYFYIFVYFSIQELPFFYNGVCERR